MMTGKMLMLRSGLQLLTAGKLNFSPSIYRNFASSLSSLSSSSALNAVVSASSSAADLASDDLFLGNQLAVSDFKAKTAPVIKMLMLRRGLQLLTAGKLNSSLSIYRSFSSSTSLFLTSAPLNAVVSASGSAADLTSDDLFLGNQLAMSDFKAETALLMKMLTLRRGLRSRSFSSSAPVNSGGLASASAADLSVGDELVDDDLISLASKPATAPQILQPGVIIYDGVCHLCHNGVKWVIKADRDRKLKFCCLQSKAAEPYLDLCGVDRDYVLRRFIFVEGFGLYHQGSTAALRVLAHLPLPYSALSTLMIVPTPLRDAVYDHVAKKRYNWFGKSDDCLVLREQDLLDRFIDREELLERSRRVL